ncbi:MAG: trigger factor [Clostridia bacterium]|nr:trigger factor [Clostridia bacterium]
MVTSVEKLPGNKVKIRFEADAEIFEQGIQKAYLKLRGRVQIPGFRKGKAPRRLIENMYGESFFYDEALEALFPDAYEAAVQEHGLRVVDRPSVDVEQMEGGKPLIFTAEVFVYPEVQLGQYKGLKVPRQERPVTEEDIDRQVQAAREKVSRMLDIEDGAVEQGDLVTLDYAGTVDGAAFDGGGAQGQQLSIGSGQFIPGFEEQMIGMGVGEERDLRVIFPADYQAEALAGKDAVFHAKVHAIQRKELPEVDDDFVRDVSEFDTVDAYKADIRATLEADAAEQVKNAFENACIEAAVEWAALQVPEPMVERRIDSLVRDFEMRLMYQGMGMEQFLQYSGQTPESLRERYREQALARAKAEAVLEAIAKAENIEPTEADIDAEIQRYAEGRQQSLEEAKKTLSESDSEYFADAAKVAKVLALLVESAVPVAEKPEPEKLPKSAKKSK